MDWQLVASYLPVKSTDIFLQWTASAIGPCPTIIQIVGRPAISMCLHFCFLYLGPVCSISNISESPHLFLYGQKTGPEEATIFEAGIFHYANSHSEQWIKRTNIRGVPCNLWRSCLNLPSSNSTMIVDWYFSGKL